MIEPLYSRDIGARYMQCLEAYSFKTMAENWGRYSSSSLVKDPYTCFERTVKLHALFGGRIVVTSIYLVSSAMLFRLFLDEGFREFIRRNPTFLELRCNFNRDFDDNETDIKVKRVLAGAKRTQDKDWTSSTFPNLDGALNTTLIRSATEAILKLDPQSGFDVNLAGERLELALKRIPERRKEHFDLLMTMPQIFDHFINDNRAVVTRTRPQWSMTPVYQILDEAMSSGGAPTHREHFEQTMRFIESRCDNDASFSSIIVAATEDKELGTAEKRAIIETGCYAYNINLIDGANAKFASFVQLPSGGPVYPRVEQLHTFEFGIDYTGAKKSLATKVGGLIHFEFDLDKISWRTIADAMEQEDVRVSAALVQRHLNFDRQPNAEAAHYDLSEHAGNLYKFFSSHGLSASPEVPGLAFVVRLLEMVLVIGYQIPKWILSPTRETMNFSIRSLDKCIVTDVLRDTAKEQFF